MNGSQYAILAYAIGLGLMLGYVALLALGSEADLEVGTRIVARVFNPCERCENGRRHLL